MSSPTIGFSISDEDRARLARLVARYAHGNRSEWFRQALDLFEQKELFDTLARAQAAGDRHTAERGFDREALRAAVAETLDSPSRAVVERARSLLADLIAADDHLEPSDPAPLRDFLAAEEEPPYG